MIVLIDTETTGLVKPELLPLKEQPHMIEIYCCKVNADLDVVDEFESMVKPPVPLPEQITKITGIEEYDLMNAPDFQDIYPQLACFFVGVETMVAHNIGFDREILNIELKRIERNLNFPWPPESICTAERSIPIEGKRMGLKDLYQWCMDKPLESHHRAKGDVLAMLDCYKYMRLEGLV